MRLITVFSCLAAAVMGAAEKSDNPKDVTWSFLDMGTGKVAFLKYTYNLEKRKLKADQNKGLPYRNLEDVLTNETENHVNAFMQGFKDKNSELEFNDFLKQQNAQRNVIVGCTGAIRSYALRKPGNEKLVFDLIKNIGTKVDYNFKPMIVAAENEWKWEKNSSQYLLNTFSTLVKQKREAIPITTGGKGEREYELKILGHFGSGGASQQFSGPGGVGGSINTGRDYHLMTALGKTEEELKREGYNLFTSGLTVDHLKNLNTHVKQEINDTGVSGNWSEPGIYNIISGFCQTWWFRNAGRAASGGLTLLQQAGLDIKKPKEQQYRAAKLVTKQEILDTIQAFKDGEFEKLGDDNTYKLKQSTIQAIEALEAKAAAIDTEGANKKAEKKEKSKLLKKAKGMETEAFGTLMCLETLTALLDFIPSDATVQDKIFFAFHRNFKDDNKAGWPCGYFVRSLNVRDGPFRESDVQLGSYQESNTDNNGSPYGLKWFYWLAFGTLGGLILGCILSCFIGGKDELEEFIEDEEVVSDGSGSDAGSDNNDKNGKADNNNKGKDSPKDKAGDAVEDGADRV